MLRNSEIKDFAIAQLSSQNKWGESVGVVIVNSILTTISVIIPFGLLLTDGAFKQGYSSYFMEIVRGKQPDFNEMFSGFNNFSNSLLASFLTRIAIVFGLIFLIVPGVILALGWSQTFRILKDNPGMSGTDAMSASWDLMQGHKGEYFIFCLSFIGWFLLCILTLGLGFIILLPYIETAKCKFYDEISGFRNTDIEELGSEVKPI
jgi:uncharacterized membrane protein